MRLKNLEINGFKSFAQKTTLEFVHPVVCIVGPNGSGKSNVVEAIRFVLGEQSMKSMRGKAGLDMIFKGSKNAPKGSSAKVSIYFDNSDKVFKLSSVDGENINLNYDVISISREVYGDGLNKYSLNGTEVRLKDINNLLSSVNIGSSGHHIISQGEADRILNASPKDRKEMVEDALGLKVYQYKIKESERKLERASENMKEVVMLRRENAPHLNFLKKQVEKFEKIKEMQEELGGLYREYFKKESLYLDEEKRNLSGQRSQIMAALKDVASKISLTEDDNSQKENKKIAELRGIEKKLNEIRTNKNDMERRLGRIEGMLELKESRVKSSGKCPVCGRDFLEALALEHDQTELAELKSSKAKLQSETEGLEKEEKDLAQKIEVLKQAINEEMESLRDKEREKFTWRVKHQELSSALELISIKEANLLKNEEALANEIKEGRALLGTEAVSFENFKIEGEVNPIVQEEQRKKIERIKIKLEDAGGGSGNDLMKEFKEVSERDEFLAKEIEDLKESIKSLEIIMADLKEKIAIEFKEGIKKINVEFKEFFSLMFGGGSGSLSVVVENKRKRKSEADDAENEMEELEEETVPEEGIEIDVNLPHKKVKELQALSGGERSLTSIALLFAMSQVNPPPFLVLDETDAALDEANSRKYGDMLEKLSKYSQLIVVTHNRETMSRAGMLYGVTLGSNSASKLLSVKFDEAVAIAK